MTTMTHFKIGDKARLIDYGATDLQFRRKLLAMGLTSDSEIEVKNIALFGCPIHISLRGMSLALRKKDIDALRWVKL